MKPSAFEYFAPAGIEEAMGLLEQYGEEARPLAGGQSLLPLMKLRLARPRSLVDLRKVAGLSEIREEGKGISLGALVRHRQIETSESVRLRCPLLSEAAAFIGNPQVRNRGTLGGSLCHADPAAELPATILALEADLQVLGPRGKRTIRAEEFFRDFLTTALEPTEVLAEVFVPAWPAYTGWAFEELRRRQVDFALVAAAVLFTVDKAGTCRRVRIALAGTGPVPLRAREAEGIFQGHPPTGEQMARAARKASEEVRPESDVHASADYRREMVAVVVHRALRTALGRVQ